MWAVQGGEDTQADSPQIFLRLSYALSTVVATRSADTETECLTLSLLTSPSNHLGAVTCAPLFTPSNRAALAIRARSSLSPAQATMLDGSIVLLLDGSSGYAYRGNGRITFFK